MIGIFILVQLLFSYMFFYAGSGIFAAIFLIICIVFSFGYVFQADMFHVSFSQIKERIPKKYSYSPKHLLPISSLLFYLGVGLFIAGISIRFSISFPLIFGITSSLLSMSIVFSYIHQKEAPQSQFLPTLHIILTTVIYFVYAAIGSGLDQYLYIHAITIVLITLVGVFGLRKSIYDPIRSSVFLGSMYVLLVITIVGFSYTYFNLTQGIYLVYIFAGITWSAVYKYILYKPIHSTIHRCITDIHIGCTMIAFLIGIYYPDWSILSVISILLFFGAHMLYEHIQNKRIFVFSTFTIFLVSVYTFFFYQIRIDISYIGFLLMSSLLPAMMIISTFLYTKRTHEVSVLHYVSIATMIIYGMYSIILLRFDILQTSFLLIVFSGIIYFSSKRLIDVR